MLSVQVRRSAVGAAGGTCGSEKLPAAGGALSRLRRRPLGQLHREDVALGSQVIVRQPGDPQQVDVSILSHVRECCCINAHNAEPLTIMAAAHLCTLCRYG